MYDPLLVPELKQMLLENDAPGMKEFCEVLHAAMVAENLESFTDDEIWKVLSHTTFDRQVEIFEFIPLNRQLELVRHVDRPRLSALVEAMASDDRADLLEALEPDQVEEILPLIAQAERADIRKLLSYSEHSAGSIMTTDYASLPERATVREAINHLRMEAPNRETIYYVYVVDDLRRLVGFVSLRKLILAKPETLVCDLMDRDPISVRVDEDQEPVAQRMARYDFLAMPVVDEQNRLVGIITHDDVLDVLQEEANEDAQRLAGVAPLEDSYLNTPLPILAYKRGVWLVLLLVAGFGTSAVLRHYGSISESLPWLEWFLPLVLASGGNAGSQSATLIVRTMATERLNAKLRRALLLREMLTGLALGICMGLIALVFSSFYVSFRQSLVVASTVLLVVSAGTVNGTLLPIMLKQMRMDPALMSNPLIASLSDLLGVVIYFNVAYWTLRPFLH